MEKKQGTPVYRYMMEGPGEEDRLGFKDNQENTLSQLLHTGFGDLSNKPHVVDAGTGVGVAARQMCHLLSKLYEGGKITLLDGSRRRLDVASENLKEFTRVEKDFIECNLERIPLEKDTVDYVFCRFVFEYLSDKETVFAELSRILKPGAKLVIGDLDMNCLNHYPISDKLQSRLEELAKAIENSGYLDLYAGRKLYELFYNAGYENIRVSIEPHHLFYGDLKANDYENWKIKLERLIGLADQGKLSLGFDLREFKEEFLSFLLLPERFSYTPLIIVEGQKPFTV